MQAIFAIPAGPDAMVANYNGDPSFGTSHSPTVNTVTRAPTTSAVVSSSGSIAQGGVVIMTDTISTSGGGFGRAR